MPPGAVGLRTPVSSGQRRRALGTVGFLRSGRPTPFEGSAAIRKPRVGLVCLLHHPIRLSQLSSLIRPVDADRGLGKKVNVSELAVLFVNGKRVSYPFGEVELTRVIADAVSGASSAE